MGLIPEYDLTDRKFYEAVYDLLVVEAGAPAHGHLREAFVLAYCETERPATEYRCCGAFGFGGKFWRNAQRFYVSCYREHETPERLATIEKVNAALEALAQKHNPRRR